MLWFSEVQRPNPVMILVLFESSFGVGEVMINCVVGGLSLYHSSETIFVGEMVFSSWLLSVSEISKSCQTNNMNNSL